MRAVATFAVVCALAAPAWADEETAQSIAEDALKNNALGLEGATADLELILVNKRGKKRKRRIRIWARRDGERSRTLARFLFPPDVAGTGFLSVETEAGESDQWLYLPALRRVRRIAGNKKGDRFAGTDFSYADLEFRQASDYTSKRLEDGTFGGKVPVYRIETIPKAGVSSPYSRTVLHVDKERRVPMQIDFFDAKGKQVKELRVKRLKKQDGRWIAREAVMKDLKRKTRTELVIEKIEYAPIDPDVFTERNLQKG